LATSSPDVKGLPLSIEYDGGWFSVPVWTFRQKVSCHCPEINLVSSVIYRSLVTLPTELPKLLLDYLSIYGIFGIHDNIFCILTGLLIRRSEIRFPARKRDFSLLQIVQTEYGAHKTAYLTGTEDDFPSDKPVSA
jgi:hypothetical protein